MLRYGIVLGGPPYLAKVDVLRRGDGPSAVIVTTPDGGDRVATVSAARRRTPIASYSYSPRMTSRFDPSPVPEDGELDAEFHMRYRPFFDRHSSIGETPGFRQKNWDSVMSFLGVDPGPPQDFRTPMQQFQQPLFD